MKRWSGKSYGSFKEAQRRAEPVDRLTAVMTDIARTQAMTRAVQERMLDRLEVLERARETARKRGGG